MRILLLVFISFIAFIGCSDCPNNIETEVTNLTDTSLALNPYFDVDILLFTDQDENEHILTKILVDNIEAVQISDDCFQTMDLQKITTQFVNQENNEVVIDLIQSITFFAGNNAFDFNDLFNLNVVLYGVSTGEISFVSDNRELLNLGLFDETVFVEDTSIFDNSFSNIYCIKPTPNRALFYSEELGVVYIKWKDGSYWLLKERI